MKEILSIGQTLEKERKTQKKNTSDIAKDLNIRENYLKAIEKDDYSQLPGKVYIAGFVKAYAEYLNLDYQELLKALRATENLQENYQNMPQVTKSSKKAQKRLFKFSVLATIFIIFFFSYYNFIEHQINHRKIEEKTSSSETLLNFFYKTQNLSSIENNKNNNEIKLELLSGTNSIENNQKLLKNNGITFKPQTINLENIDLYSQKSKPPFARILLKANQEVWFQIRNIENKKIYVSKVLPEGKYYWVTPWSDVVLDVADASSIEIIIDDQLYGALGPSSKRIRGIYLDVGSLEQYFENGENLTSDKIENY